VPASAPAGWIGAVTEPGVAPQVGQEQLSLPGLARALLAAAERSREHSRVWLAIGGFGSYLGALVGGMLIGLIESITARYLEPSYGDLIVFAVLLAVLMVKPTGLFRSASVRTV